MKNRREKPSLVLPPPQRILVVDDDLEIQRVIRKVLSRTGFIAVPCHTAGQAIRAAHRIRPAAILLDANLGPGSIQGFQVCAILKKMPATRTIPVLMMSGVCLSDEFGQEAARLGAVGYWVKGDLWEKLPVRLSAALEERTSSANQQPSDNPDDLLQHGTVLVADDEEDWLSLSRRWLEGSGHNVLTTANAAHVGALAIKHRPDCIILDYQMRGLNANDVCRQLQQDLLTKSIPVVIFTGHEVTRSSSLDRGADQFVLKGPLSSEELPRAVSCCIRRYRWSTGVLVRDDLTLDPSHRTIMLGGKLISTLSQERFDFLYLIVSRSPHFVSHDELCERILHTKTESPESRALPMLALRTKEAVGEELSQRIHCVKGFGWIYEIPLLAPPNR